MDRDEAPTSTPESWVKTRIFIISDTHGMDFSSAAQHCQSADVLIHCGDITDESKITEFRTAVEAMKRFQAPLKLVIAGNHDFTLDTPVFKTKVAEARLQSEPELVSREYGEYGEARKLFDEASDAGIVFLEEGAHTFSLENGASLTAYASPYTPSQGNWGFGYHPGEGHEFAIPVDTDLVITHGPPEGIMDRTSSRKRAGSSHLFAAVAKARLRLHCFGHIHEGWEAKLVTWRENATSESPSHLTHIDNDKSVVIASLAKLTRSKFDSAETTLEKENLAKRYADQGYCQTTAHCEDDNKPPRETRAQTLFVNAAMKSNDEDATQFPWLVDIELPRIGTHKSSHVAQMPADPNDLDQTVAGQKRWSR